MRPSPQPPGRLQIAARSQVAIRNAARLSRDGLETGGILLGTGPDASGTVRVALAGGPGPRAERRRDYFRRDLAYAQRLAVLAREYGLCWVGDWHTHPRGPGSPSDFDIGVAAHLLEDPELSFPVFATVIVTSGLGRDWASPRLHRYLFAP